MIPFIIAGAIGFGIAKLLEKDTKKYADGGMIFKKGDKVILKDGGGQRMAIIVQDGFDNKNRVRVRPDGFPMDISVPMEEKYSDDKRVYVIRKMADGGETFMAGGMTNENILRSFLISERETQTNNLATFYSTLGGVMLLRNYGTLIAKRMGRRVEITNVKHSKTTSAITNRLKALAEEMGYNVSYVSEFEEGGEAGYSKKDRVIDYYYENDVFDDYETYGLSEDDLNNQDKVVKSIIKYHGLNKPENVEERFETLGLEDFEEQYAEGGGTYVDLFEDYENIPLKVQAIIDKYAEEFGDDFGGMDYKDTQNMLEEIEEVGYTFGYGLDNSPYGLRPISVRLNQLKGFEDYDDDEMANGGEAGYMKKGGVATNSKYEQLYLKANNNIQGALELYAGELGIYNMFFGHKVDASKKSKVKKLQMYLEKKYSKFAEGGEAEDEMIKYAIYEDYRGNDIKTERFSKGMSENEIKAPNGYVIADFDEDEDGEFYVRFQQDKEEYADGGEAKKRRRSATVQYGVTDKAVDKTRFAKPVGYRFTDAKAMQLRKKTYAIPTEREIIKHLGNGVYKENRKNRSDKNREFKL